MKLIIYSLLILAVASVSFGLDAGTYSGNLYACNSNTSISTYSLVVNKNNTISSGGVANNVNTNGTIVKFSPITYTSTANSFTSNKTGCVTFTSKGNAYKFNFPANLTSACSNGCANYYANLTFTAANSSNTLTPMISLIILFVSVIAIIF